MDTKDIIAAVSGGVLLVGVGATVYQLWSLNRRLSAIKIPKKSVKSKDKNSPDSGE